jgi:hypothetical protein
MKKNRLAEKLARCILDNQVLVHSQQAFGWQRLGRTKGGNAGGQSTNNTLFFQVLND